MSDAALVPLFCILACKEKNLIVRFHVPMAVIVCECLSSGVLRCVVRQKLADLVHPSSGL